MAIHKNKKNNTYSVRVYVNGREIRKRGFLTKFIFYWRIARKSVFE